MRRKPRANIGFIRLKDGTWIVTGWTMKRGYSTRALAVEAYINSTTAAYSPICDEPLWDSESGDIVGYCGRRMGHKRRHGSWRF